MKLKARLTVVLILVACFAFSQDLIIKKDSTEIYCKIVYVNLKSLYYLVPNNSNEIKIDKVDVQKYVFDWNQMKPAILPPPAKVVDSKTMEILTHKLSLNTSGGISIPNGNFASTDAYNDQAGFGLNGWYAEFGLNLKLHRFIRLSLNYAMQTNPFNSSAYDKGFKTRYPSASMSTIAGAYRMTGLLGGINFHIPMSVDQKVQLHVNLQGGSPMYESPDLQSTVTYNGFKTYFHFTAGQTHTTTLKIGMGMEYHLSEDVNAFALVNLFSAKPSFLITTSVNGSIPSSETLVQEMKSAHLQVGLIIKIF